MNNTENESGRSMVEMLGVLAVMGVLSVGGVAMYTSAMNKHRANEILNEASKRAVMVASQAMAGKTGTISLSEFGNNAVSGATFGTEAKVENNQIKLTLSGVESSICTKMKAALGDNTVMAVDNDCTIIAFNADMTKGVAKPTSCNPACTGGKECVNGTCQCPDDKPLWIGSTCVAKATCTENQWYNAVYNRCDAKATCSSSQWYNAIANTCDAKKNCSGYEDFYVPELNSCYDELSCRDDALEIDSDNKLCHLNCSEDETPYLRWGFSAQCCPNTKELKRVFENDPNYHCVDPCPSGEYYCAGSETGSINDSGYLMSDGTCADDALCCPGKILSFPRQNGELRACCEEGVTVFDIDGGCTPCTGGQQRYYNSGDPFCQCATGYHFDYENAKDCVAD